MTDEERKQAHRDAVHRHQKRYYRLNLTFPDGTKERLDALGLEKSNTRFIRDTVLAELDRLERILK